VTELGVVVQRPSLRSSGNAARVSRCVGLLVVLTMLFAWVGTAAADTKRVVLLHSFGRDFKPWSDYARSIRSELERQSPWQLDITDHSLVTARSSNDDSEVAFVAYLGALFANQPPDLIVSVGAPAAAFVQRHRPQLFVNTPMVFTAVDERRVQFSALSANDAVVAVRIDYLAAIENILQVLPDTKNVTVVVGTSPIEQFWRKEIGNAVKPLSDQISFTWTNNLSFDNLLKYSATLPPHSAIFWELMIVDAAGVVHEGNTALERLHSVSNAPIFSYDESFFGREIVGGPLLAVLDSSRETASVAIRILAGEKPNDIKIPPIKFAPAKFDWRELQRWGISESRLPPGSQVLFRNPTAWEQYRWQITSMLLALLVLSAMTTWLLVERFGRHRAEGYSRTLSLKVMHLNRAAEAGALSASFAHDLGQPLVAIGLTAQMAKDLLKDRPELGKLREALVDIMHANDHAAEIIKQFRKLFKRGGVQDIQETDLQAAIADALSVLSSEANRRQVVLHAGGHQGPLMVRADPVHLLQVLLNLATNAMDAMANTPRAARRIGIRVALLDDCKVEVVVTDSGPGIPQGRMNEIFDTFYTTKADGTGFGLSISRTIVETYGGKIWAENCTSGGAAFHFTFPVRRGSKQPTDRVRQV
jgi:signal transduction histidine kinase